MTMFIGALSFLRLELEHLFLPWMTACFISGPHYSIYVMWSLDVKYGTPAVRSEG